MTFTLILFNTGILCSEIACSTNIAVVYSKYHIYANLDVKSCALVCFLLQKHQVLRFGTPIEVSLELLQRTV